MSPSSAREATPDVTTPTSTQTTPPRAKHSGSAHSHTPETTPTSGLTRQPLRPRQPNRCDSKIIPDNETPPTYRSGAGLVLTRPGYYTDPPLSELKVRVGEGDRCEGVRVGEGDRCEVENFTVGRRGFGKVCFFGVTDVARLDLDSLGMPLSLSLYIYIIHALSPSFSHLTKFALFC